MVGRVALTHVIYVRIVAPEFKMVEPVLYILLSLKDKRTYIGYTNNLEGRIKEHNRGKVKATRHRSPFILVYTEELKTLEEAKKREKYYKSGAGRRKLKELLFGSPLISSK